MDNEGSCVNVTSDVYREQVIDRFVADVQTFCYVKDIPYEEQVFQQDGAIPHTGRGNLQYIEDVLPGELISRLSDYPYPQRSPDLTPLDAFLWGLLRIDASGTPCITHLKN